MYTALCGLRSGPGAALAWVTLEYANILAGADGAELPADPRTGPIERVRNYRDAERFYRRAADIYRDLAGHGARIRRRRRHRDAFVVAMLRLCEGGPLPVTGDRSLAEAAANAWGAEPRSIEHAWNRRLLGKAPRRVAVKG